MSSPPGLFIWFTHAYNIVFDFTLVVKAQMFRNPINYSQQHIYLDGIIVIPMNDPVNVPRCQKLTEYQANCFTVFSLEALNGSCRSARRDFTSFGIWKAVTDYFPVWFSKLNLKCSCLLEICVNLQRHFGELSESVLY